MSRIGILFITALLCLAGPICAMAQTYNPSAEGTFQPGDTIIVDIDKVESLSGEMEISDDGYVDFLYIGKIKVAGKTTFEIDQELTEIYGRDFLNNPTIRISRQINTANVVAPTIEIETATSDVSSTMLSGSVEENPDQDSTPFIRTEDTLSGQRTINVSATQTNESVQALTPSLTRQGVGRILINGQIARPGLYELGNYQPFSLVLSQAGGALDEADLNEIIVFRSEADGSRNAYSIAFTNIQAGDEADPIIIPGDYIFVKNEDDKFDWDNLSQILTLIDMPLDAALTSAP